jgi:TonB family protein
MISRTFLLPLFISVSMHAAAFSVCLMYGNITGSFEKDPDVIFVGLVPSVADSASNANLAAHRAGHPSGIPKMLSAKPRLVGTICHEQRPQCSSETTAQEQDTPGFHHQQDMPGSSGTGNEMEGHGAGASLENPDGYGGGNARAASSPSVIAVLSKPEYPRYSRIHGEEGTVVLEVEITTDGRSGRVTVIRSSGYQRLDDAAVHALERAVFVPAVTLGKPVASTKRIAIRFAIEDQGE